MRSSAEQDGRVKRWNMTTAAWLLAGFLLITAALLFSAREERLAYPSATNVRASGYAAFAELLRRDGYHVTVNRSIRPRFDPDSLVISSFFRPSPVSELAESFSGDPVEPEEPLPYLESLAEHVRAGGSVLSIQHRKYFERASELSEEPHVIVSEERTFEISTPYGELVPEFGGFAEIDYYGWYLGDDPFVTYTASGDGVIVSVADGLPATNRFLARHDNAEFMLDLVRRLAEPGSEVVFVEAGIGNSESPTVARTLGGWAVAARWQGLLLFAVLLFTLGRRFGLAERDRLVHRGSRELFDAVADVFRRSGNTGLALDNVLGECDQRMRTVLRGPRSLKRNEMLQRVPHNLREQYLNVSELAVARTTPRVATAAAARLLKLLEQFETDSREARGLKR
ncbi:MAG: DUF4350 domain-containing protein [Armatimonadetes bacterium]|nr:DUF4350 domain-containing protein [Armatimonadota bacterium]